ncbi:MAG: hypothetical protein ACJ72N_20595 [Labedaea sp.]
MLLTGLGLTAGGGALLWLDGGHRDAAGYVTTATQRFTDPGYALRFDAADATGWPGDVSRLGDVRVRVAGSDSGPVFVGICRTGDAMRYLSAVPHGRMGWSRNMTGMMGYPGSRSPAAPAEQGFWVASTSGPGPLSLSWAPQPGSWSLVVMNVDAQPGLRADLDVGATVPALRPLAWALLGGGVVLLVGGAVLIALTVRSRPYGGQGTGDRVVG